MHDLIDPNSFKGNTSGCKSYMSDWEEFLIYYQLTNLQEELKRYSRPNSWIADLLN